MTGQRAAAANMALAKAGVQLELQLFVLLIARLRQALKR